MIRMLAQMVSVQIPVWKTRRRPRAPNAWGMKVVAGEDAGHGGESANAVFAERAMRMRRALMKIQ